MFECRCRSTTAYTIEKVEASEQNEETNKGRARELKHHEQDRYCTEC